MAEETPTGFEVARTPPPETQPRLGFCFPVLVPMLGFGAGGLVCSSLLQGEIIVRAIVLTVVAIALTGCAGPGGGFMNTNTFQDAGVAPVNYEQTSKQYLLRVLKDPDGLRDFSAGAPERSSCSVGIYGSFHGWRVPVQYNARNSFGGYVGLQRTYLWYHGEALRGVSASPGFCPEAPAWR